MSSSDSPTPAPEDFHEISPAVMIRRALFILLLLSLALIHLLLDFKGLTHKNGIEQAQISREVARGNGFSTKVIKPVAVYQVNKHQESKGEAPVGFKGFYDTYHAPLNPLFNSVLMAMGKSGFEYDANNSMYAMDYWISGGSIVLFLCAIGVSYLLVARIFDAKIAGVMAFLMLLSDLMWDFTQTGLPQMLMLFLFSFALYFLYKAVECQQEERSPYLWAALCGGFLGLLVLSNWIAVWLLIGLIVYAALYFKPRGVVAVVMFSVFILIVGVWLVRNYELTGRPEGSGQYDFYSGMPGQTEGMVQRNYDPEGQPIVLDGFILRTVNTALNQLENLYQYLGAVLAAPIFFLALMHPFRRKEIADFRWCILTMWLFGVIGMSIFGLNEKQHDPNQLHLLFVPIMTGYGLAFLSILWNRMNLPMEMPIVRNGHFVLAITITALPMLLGLPKKLQMGMYLKDHGAKMNYPPYHPPIIKLVSDTVEDHEVIVSDMPWAVAWYGDKKSLWIPRTVKQFDQLYTYADDRNEPLAGILLTPETTNQPLSRSLVQGEYAEWGPMIIQGGYSASSVVQKGSFGDAFPFKQPRNLGDSFRNEMIFYTDRNRGE